jgi:type I restriction enzyme M protein
VTLGPGPHLDFNAFLAAAEQEADRHHGKLTAKRQKLMQTALAVKDESGAPVIKKVHKPGKAEPDPLYGLIATGSEGSLPRSQFSLLHGVVEYEPDPELRDTEQVPLLEDGGIEAFFRREVLPHVPDAWIDKDATKIGYEISFTRYFYKPQPLRTLEEIRADIETLEKETEGLLEQILVDVEVGE